MFASLRHCAKVAESCPSLTYEKGQFLSDLQTYDVSCFLFVGVCCLECSEACATGTCAKVADNCTTCKNGLLTRKSWLGHVVNVIRFDATPESDLRLGGRKNYNSEQWEKVKLRITRMLLRKKWQSRLVVSGCGWPSSNCLTHYMVLDHNLGVWSRSEELTIISTPVVRCLEFRRGGHAFNVDNLACSLGRPLE